jgi:prophage regulatory protein
MTTKIIRLAEVKKRSTFSRSTIYRLMGEKTFPKPINLSTNSIGWLESDIDNWLQERINKSKGVQNEQS